MNNLKWSTGEAYYKSTRQQNKLEQVNTNSLEYDSQRNAINQSLADYNQDSDLIDITNSFFSRNQDATGTRREDIDLKMADRELISQCGVNPFLQTSYVNDIVTRDMFLKPINTTQGKTKVSVTGDVVEE
jgi:hypothetical protein